MPEAQPGQEQRMEPCPGCGKNSTRVIGGPDSAGGLKYWAGCDYCHWRTWGDTEAEAIANWNARTRPTADLGEDGELLLRARNLLQEADGWLAISSVVNHDELCAKIAETVAKIDAVLSRSGG